jgi:ABC-2 type transport system permease protein
LALLKGFTTILLKELKELMRDPKILIGMIVLPLIMFPVLGLVMGYAVQSAQEEAQRATLLVVDNDNNGTWSNALASYLNSTLNVDVVKNLSPQNIIDQGLLEKYNSTMFLEIPSGFSANLTMHANGARNVTGMVNVYGVFNGGGGIFSSIGGTTVTAVVGGFNRAVAPDVVAVSQSSIIKGQIEQGVDPSTLSSLMLSQSIALPITIMIMLTYAMQIAATSVAMEKEEKTLETLLTTPVDRFAILMGKVSSTIIVAGAASVAVLVGYNYMIGSISNGIAGNVGGSVDLVALGLVPSVGGYVLLGISLFFTLLSALALAVIMSAFSENVRGAQALVGYIYPLIFIPSLALVYLDMNSLPLAIKAIFYAIPYSHPIIASKAVVTGDYGTVVFGIVYVAIFTVVIMYIASRLFATEKILTAKLRFGKGKTKQHSE